MNDSSRMNTYTNIWMQCLDQAYVMPIMCQSFQALCFLLATPALIWCIWISLNGSFLKGLKPTLVFPINLFAVELVFCVNGLLEGVTYLIRQNNMFVCVVEIFYYLSWTCRPVFQSSICVERYLAVAQPVAFLKYRLRRYRVVCSTLVWMLSITHACYFTFKDNFGISNNVLLAVYCVAVVIISLCCFAILRVLKQPGPGEVEGGRGGEKKQGTTDPQKRRAFGIILTNLVITLVSSISVVFGYSGMSYSVLYICNVFPISIIVNIFSVMASPLMHLYREGKLPCRRGPETH